MTNLQEQLPATDSQILLITRLCMGLGIKEPLEERKMTIAQAGTLIRQLTSYKKRRRP